MEQKRNDGRAYIIDELRDNILLDVLDSATLPRISEATCTSLYNLNQEDVFPGFYEWKVEVVPLKAFN